MNEKIESELEKLKESKRKICIRCFVGEKFKNGLSGERYIGGISGVNLKWYFDKQDMIYNFDIDGNTARAYLSEIRVDLAWNEIVINYENF